MLTKLKEFKSWYLRKKVLRDLKRQNLYAIEVEKVMEEFATNRVLSGESADSRNNSRNVLVKHQQTIAVKSDFQDFLNRL